MKKIYIDDRFNLTTLAHSLYIYNRRLSLQQRHIQLILSKKKKIIYYFCNWQEFTNNLDSISADRRLDWQTPTFCIWLHSKMFKIVKTVWYHWHTYWCLIPQTSSRGEYSRYCPLARQNYRRCYRWQSLIARSSESHSVSSCSWQTSSIAIRFKVYIAHLYTWLARDYRSDIYRARMDICQRRTVRAIIFHLASPRLAKLCNVYTGSAIWESAKLSDFSSKEKEHLQIIEFPSKNKEHRFVRLILHLSVLSLNKSLFVIYILAYMK